jgi:flagellin
MAKSLNRLSTGLRINSAADDASGMAIADSLRSQSMGLGQAIRNANDGISIVQTADGALEEAINITNTIKTKSIQAAQDGQTLDSRKKIQADIDKLLQEVDILAATTSFNGKKLLSGEFTNNKFQIGSTSGEVVDISIGAANTTKVGHISTSTLTVENTGSTSLTIRSNVSNTDVTLQAIDLQFNNNKENGIGALADVINKSAEQLGMTAQAVVETSSNGTISAGSLQGGDTGFKINGVQMGAVTVVDNDADGALMAAINQKSDQTGVTASVNQGVLTLSSSDGRAIQVEGGVDTVMGQTAGAMSTLGEIRLTQTGANGFNVQTAGTGVEIGANFKTNADALVTDDMVLSAGSLLAAGSTLAAGSILGGTVEENVATQTQDALIKAGSTIGNTSTIGKGTVIGGDVVITVETVTTTATLTAGSILAATSTLAAGTLLTTDITTAAGDTITAGTTLSLDTVTAASAITLNEDMVLATGTTVAATSTAAAGSSFESDDLVTGGGTMVVTEDFVLTVGSNMASSTLAAGTVLGAVVAGTSNLITVTQDMTVKSGSTILAASTLAQGSTLGAEMTMNTTTTLTSGMQAKAGSTLATATTIAAGTYLTNDMTVVEGGSTTVIGAGTTLEQAVVTSGAQTLVNDMVLAKDSEIASLTTFASNGGGGLSGASLSEAETLRMTDIDVTSQEGAQKAISISDAALASFDKIRADLGSVQNQLSSTISNISVTKTNVQAAESNIRDVDFAEESANFTKLQILSQTGAFALSQANASSQIVTSLLQ